MIAADTNVLLRYMIADDPSQWRAANTLFAREDIGPVLIGLNVIAETWWFLVKRRGYDRTKAVAVLRQLLDDANLQIAESDAVEAAVDAYAEGPAGFVDYLIAADASAHGARTTYTFDLDAARHPTFTALS